MAVASLQFGLKGLSILAQDFVEALDVALPLEDLGQVGGRLLKDFFEVHSTDIGHREVIKVEQREALFMLWILDEKGRMLCSLKDAKIFLHLFSQGPLAFHNADTCKVYCRQETAQLFIFIFWLWIQQDSDDDLKLVRFNEIDYSLIHLGSYLKQLQCRAENLLTDLYFTGRLKCVRILAVYQLSDLHLFIELLGTSWYRADW